MPFVRVIGLLIAITWLPLVAITCLEGTAVAGTVAIPFFSDHLPHGRFLIAAPLLLWLHYIVEHRTGQAMQRLITAELIRPEDEQALRRLIETAARAWRSRIVHAMLIAITCLSAVTPYVWLREQGISHWMLAGDRAGAELSIAGAWNLFVATPLVRLLFLLAVWKFATWLWLLVRLRRLDLRIDPLHPDRRCGLLFLGEAQLAFLPLIAAFGVQLGCTVAVLVRHQGAPVSSFKLLGAAFVLLSVALILGPLAVFARRARIAIEQTQDALSAWSALTVQRLRLKIPEVQRGHLSTQLSTTEITSMAAGASLFDRAFAARAVPIDLRQILAVAATAMASALFPLLALLPLGEIFERLAKILL